MAIEIEESQDAVEDTTDPTSRARPDDAPPEAYRVKSRRRELAETILPPFVVGAGFLGLWYFVSYGLLEEGRRFLLHPPHEVWQVGFADWDNFSEILESLWSSTRVAMIGLFISIVLGFFLATIMSQAKTIERGPSSRLWSCCRPSRFWRSFP